MHEKDRKREDWSDMMCVCDCDVLCGRVGADEDEYCVWIVKIAVCQAPSRI
jgi:hypothetical protein